MIPTTQAALGIASVNSGSSTSPSSMSNSTIGAVVACIILFLIIIGACVFIIKKSNDKKTPFEIWTSHYSNNQPAQQQPIDEDIHHFYHKTPRPSTPRLSINPNTPFTPHISSKTSFRNSQLGGQLGSQRNSISTKVHNRL
jgi:hypothetical protein